MDKINLVNNILDDIKVKKAQSRKLVNSKNISAHRNLLTDIKNEEMKLFEMLDCVSNESNLSADALICGMKHAVGLMPATEVDKHIFNYMKQSAGKDGGFLVPEDIQLDVKSLRNSAVNLESFVNVEPVITKEGTRFIELQADVFPLEEVPEGEIIPEIDESKIVKVKYKIKKRAGIIKMSNELLADSNEAILRWLKVWLGKKTRATRNKAILDAINKTTVGR